MHKIRAAQVFVARAKPDADMEEWEQEMWESSARAVDLAQARRNEVRAPH